MDLQSKKQLDTHNNVNVISMFKKKHPVIFCSIVVILVLMTIVGVIAIIIYFVKKTKTKTTEGFVASNNINNEFDYVNSYIQSTLGDMTDMDVITKNASKNIT